MIVVTHEIQFAREAADASTTWRRCLLQIGPPEQVIDRPRDKRTGGSVGSWGPRTATTTVRSMCPRSRCTSIRTRASASPRRRSRSGFRSPLARSNRGPACAPGYHPGMPALTRSDVEHVAHLARLGLTRRGARRGSRASSTTSSTSTRSSPSCDTERSRRPRRPSSSRTSCARTWRRRPAGRGRARERARTQRRLLRRARHHRRRLTPP